MPQKKSLTSAKFQFQEPTVYKRAKKRSDGAWYCTGYNKLASTKHEKDECHRCSDWNGCGRDCTLSKIYCEQCGTAQTI